MELLTQELIKPLGAVIRDPTNRRIWFPPFLTPEQVLEADQLLPPLSDMRWAVVCALGLTAVRLLLQSFIFDPAAIRQLDPPVAAYLRGDPSAPRPTDRQLRKANTSINKFTESCWRCSIYVFTCIMGFYVLHDKIWFRDGYKCFEGFPFHTVQFDVQVYYMISIGLYLHLLVALFIEQRKKDFGQMMAHHIATLFLLIFSYMVGLYRIGTLVLLVHDLSDPFLEAAKLALYAGYNRLADGLFVCFATIFGISRLYIYPFYVINSSAVQSYELGYPVYFTWIFFNGLLASLLALHIFWFYLILRMVVGFIVKGKVDKDVRSESEKDD